MDPEETIRACKSSDSKRNTDVLGNRLDSRDRR